MADLLKNFASGDELTARLVDAIVGELNRLRQMTASLPIVLDDGDGEFPPQFRLYDEPDLVPYQNGGTAIAGGTLGSPTSGTVTLLNDKYPGPGFENPGGSTADTETLYNPYTGTVGANVFGWAKWRNGYLYVHTADCPSS